MKFYLEFFKYGCPPHGGFGLGIDRLTMLLLGLTCPATACNSSSSSEDEVPPHLKPETPEEPGRDYYPKADGATRLVTYNVGVFTKYISDGSYQMIADMMRASTTAEIYGPEAVEAYAADPESMRFDCYFTEGVSRFVFDGNTVTGLDEAGNEVFSHSYTYVQELPEAISCYAYKTDDADAGEFTYICLSPDTPATTWHIEFRYGDDLEALGQMYEGKYAFWQAAGMLEDADEEMIDNCIELFCTENASEK